MALLTMTGMEKILRRIMETGGLTEDMENDIKRLKDDFDEREGILKKYGDTYDGEDRDEYDFAEMDADTVYTPREEEKDWKEEYGRLKKRYMDRFFGRETDAEEIVRDQEEDVKRDGTPQTFDELLKRTEG